MTCWDESMGGRKVMERCDLASAHLAEISNGEELMGLGATRFSCDSKRIHKQKMPRTLDIEWRKEGDSSYDYLDRARS